MTDDKKVRDEHLEEDEISDEEINGVSGGKFNPTLIRGSRLPGKPRLRKGLPESPLGRSGIVTPNC